VLFTHVAIYSLGPETVVNLLVITNARGRIAVARVRAVCVTTHSRQALQETADAKGKLKSSPGGPRSSSVLLSGRASFSCGEVRIAVKRCAPCNCGRPGHATPSLVRSFPTRSPPRLSRPSIGRSSGVCDGDRGLQRSAHARARRLALFLCPPLPFLTPVVTPAHPAFSPLRFLWPVFVLSLATRRLFCSNVNLQHYGPRRGHRCRNRAHGGDEGRAEHRVCHALLLLCAFIALLTCTRSPKRSGRVCDRALRPHFHLLRRALPHLARSAVVHKVHVPHQPVPCPRRAPSLVPPAFRLSRPLLLRQCASLFEDSRRGSLWRWQACAGLLSALGTVAVCSLALGNGLVMMRVVSLWDHNKSVFRVMYAFYILTYGVTISTFLVALMKIARMSFVTQMYHSTDALCQPESLGTRC
jgi:hypothetical protein